MENNLRHEAECFAYLSVRKRLERRGLFKKKKKTSKVIFAVLVMFSQLVTAQGFLLVR